MWKPKEEMLIKLSGGDQRNNTATATTYAREEPGVRYVYTECRAFSMDWFIRPIFQETFFRAPCRGCGSNHSLLREIGGVGEIPQYEYRCNVIEPTPLYENDDMTQVKMRFRLGTWSFTIDCGYDLEHALQRLVILRGNRNDDRAAHETFDSFTNEVRRLCNMERTWRERG